jgi:DeoR/GlpR family transcriptional regulator of sugar metabolism
MTENQEEKNRIGQSAAQLIEDGETIFLGSGTTTLEVARNLDEKKKLTIITNALNIATLLSTKPNITLIVIGGYLRHSEMSMIGHLTVQALKELRADKVIMGVRAVSLEQGLTNDALAETMTDRSIIQFAPEVILVTDHSKFGKVASALIAPITHIHKIVTDDKIPSDIVTELSKLGIEVTIASVQYSPTETGVEVSPHEVRK